ncbi:cupin domain-containing protein [Methylobacterium nonmethylotrophicum]|uniref:Cupin domain-containing protein n=1 Tax=Methylobacterium nonmethylotrophicum TaxID=1141884 RepID=A0A4Z0NMA0_9HYPH|nr:cupin domain-containing protein [Methylobacterium nonmethylotrophicum]TGD97006.1 cupin domain-containing protein [Methylobacterium nonmethylotrophicum]
MGIIKQLVTMSGPMLAYLSVVPVLRAFPFVQRSAPRLLDGPVQTNSDFPKVQPPAEAYLPPRSHILSGNPVQTATYVYTSPDGLFAAGIWTCQPGKFRIDFGRAEFIQLLEGVVVVTDAEGSARTYRAGDAFVTPKGFSGTWEVIEPVKKHFTWYGSGE